MNKVKGRIFQKLYADDLIQAAYRGILKREPDPKGLEEYRKAIARSGDLAEVFAAIASSGEIGQKNFTALAPELVQAVYRGVLGREADPDGLATYTAKLNGLDDLVPILDSIVHSKEFLSSRLKVSPNPKITYDNACLVFLHIQKTGGTSLQNMLIESCGAESVYKEHKDTLHRHTQDELSKYSVFAGHFNYDSLLCIPSKNKSLFTFLREPKSRLFSLYYFWRAHEPGHASFHFGTKLANELIMEQFFEHEKIIKISDIWNHMTWVIMGQHKWAVWRKLLSAQKNQESISEIIEKTIRPAIIKRLNEFTFIGLQEDFSESVDMLHRVMGKQRPETLRADHSLEKLMKRDPNFKKKIDRQPITPHLDAALDSLVQLDNIVYEEGKKLFAVQRAKTSPSDKVSTCLLPDRVKGSSIEGKTDPVYEELKKLTVEELCETAENYFKCITDPTFQMAKPFCNMLEAPAHLQNMGLLLSGLHLGKTMTVLDFGAGTCWFSRYLNQMQCQTISCDVSKTALEIGRRLFAEYPIIGAHIAEPAFLHFDGHKIDLPNESVDRIICFDAFHHVPNKHEVISEFARVLKKGGIIGFNEPGRFHSRSPQSRREMNNFKVLEDDVDVNEIFLIAKDHGFTDIKCTLLSNNMLVSLGEHQLLTGDVPDSNLERRIFESINNKMTSQNVFFLYKGGLMPDSRSHIGLSHTISTDNDTFTVKCGECFNLSVRISNTGTASWLAKNFNNIGVVSIGTKLYDENKNLLNLDFARFKIPAPTPPGQTFEQRISTRFNNRGVFKLALDLVSEGVCWFGSRDSKPKSITVTVE